MKPSGPHPVGVADVAMRAPQLVVPAAPNVKRVAGRLFYPCKKSWTAPATWMPHSNYARGYIGFLFRFIPKKTLQAQLARPLLTAIGWALGTSRTLPVYYQAPAADASSLGQRLPVVVFSHGLAGTRNAYSSICMELASQGYVVMAIEHGDGSASTARLPRLAPADRAAAAAALKAAAAAAPAAPPAASSSTTLSPAVYAGARLAGRAVRTGAPPTANCVPPIWSYDDGNGNGNGGVTNGGGGGDEVSAKEAEGSEAKVEAAKGHGLAEATNGGGGSGSGANGNGSADGSEWYFYGGLGDDVEQRLKTEHRLGEVAAALRVMEAVDAGITEGLLELPPSVSSTLAGRLDLGRAAVMGHSYGGATAAAAAACLDRFHCAVALDPWWDCLPESLPVTSSWPRSTPLLVVGSHDWNTPNAAGKLACGGENQQRVFAAAAAGGGGVLHAVPRGSSHSNFDDVLLLYGKTLTWVLQALDFKTALEPAKAHAINMWCITRFLERHLPRPAAPDQQGRQGHTQGPASPLTEADLQVFREGVGADCEMLSVQPGAVAAVTAGAPVGARG